MSRRRQVLVFLASVLLGALLTGCGDSRECLHHTSQVVTSTTVVSNGKTVVPVVSTHLVTYCDQYAPEVPK